LNLDPVDIDARQSARILVAANREHMLAPGGVVERYPHHHGADEQVEKRHWHQVKEATGRQSEEHLLVGAGREGATPLGRDIDQAAYYGEGAQRSDEGTKVQLGDGQAIEEADRRRRK